MPAINQYPQLKAADGSDNVNFTQAGSNVTRTVQDKLQDLVSVKDFGAIGDGIANDTAAFNAATGVTIIPEGIYRTNTTPTGPDKAIVFGAQFTGTAPYDAWLPAFGFSTLEVMSDGGQFNALLGAVRNTLPPATLGFPTGVTGYGRNDNAGNTVFGIYAEARQYATTGCVTNEIDSFNHGAAPSPNLPPDRSIGTPQQQPVALTVAAGGDFNSSIGIHIAREGSLPQKFLTGLYTSPDACVTYGLFLDATSTSTYIPLVLKHAVGQIGLQIKGEGTPVAANAWLSYMDGSNVTQFSIKQNGALSFNSALTQSTRGAAGAAQVLPSNPTGYIRFEVDGFTKVIPYYEP